MSGVVTILARVGDPLPEWEVTWSDDDVVCLRRWQSWTCTAPRGHVGPHVACDGVMVCAVWPCGGV